ncbi:Ti-type conjugative transfer relaxase TraA [Salmonella enterica]|uniref:Ti-type conjugative transfer relaxase TraA n=1 Tax=Salmonella enterica TaxID=28901 RepID=A0A5T3SMN3_SALER|nr:Ti-type conjugative transfer relaxase TraA [Salmonella enterica]
MAIYHLSTQPLSRKDGRSAVAAAAYRSGTELADVRTGQVFDYTRKGGVLSAEIVTPEGIAAPQREALWNAAEAAENRKDARIAREWRAALPVELSDAERRELAREFGQYIADRFGVAVDVCVHAPDKEGDERNFHVHMLATTRQIEADGSLGKKASIELGNKDRERAGIPGTTQQELVEIRAHWAELTNLALERAGQSVRVDHRSYAAQGIDLTPTKHVGVSAVGMDRRGKDADRANLHAETRAENAAKIEANPSLILEKITQTQAVFDRRDIARELNRYIDDPQQFQNLMVRLEAAPELVQLAGEVSDGRRTIPAKLTTREMIEAERAMIGSAEKLAGAESHAVRADKLAAAVGRYDSLSDEQRAAVEHVTGVGRLAVVIGDAGTGKSFAMRVAKEAWEAEGYRVRGCALAGKAADELQAGSGIESRTIHSLEHAWKRGNDPLTNRDVLVIDEAGMVGSRQLARVLAEAEKAGAKVVMLGDDKQLAAIEAGAGFRAITDRVGAAEITQIRRQREDWARDASAEFARGDVRTALDAYNERGRVRLVDDREAAKAALATDWLADREKGGSSIILAHTNADVRDLNDTIRQARQRSGELGQSAEFVTERGRREFAEGDRLVFLKNDRNIGVKNGTLGTVTRAEDGRLAVRLDDGRDVDVDAGQYANVDHGYAVTVHKAQGVTVDRAYVLATGGMDRNLAYVGMTRHRDAATLYAGRDDFGSYDKLARGLARQRPKESTLDFAESAYGFADRRDFDGAAVVGRWIERGREKLAELGERAKAALQQAFERAGIRRDVPNMEQASPDAIEALRQPQERPRGVFLPRQYSDEDLIGEARTPAKPADELTPEAAATLERIRAARAQERGEQVRPAPEPADRSQQMLGQLRDELTKAQQAGDELGAVVAAGRLSKAEELAEAGEPLAHHTGTIQQAGKAALNEWVKKQRGPEPQAQPQDGLTPEAAAALERIQKARSRERGEQQRGHGKDNGHEL